MMQFRVRADLRVQSGDFGTVVTDGVLEVPDVIAAIAKRERLQNVEEFLSFLHAYPNNVAVRLTIDHDVDGMDDVAHVIAARDRLVAQLAGYVDDTFLRPSKPPGMGMGAFPNPKERDGDH